ncbi:hypothetical protein V6N11_057892 [Hibiscus sabdariffa]|uniref:Uncharacterized protein n=2 Tax=Hibiscus sabdariffa TaxID=183260 RepID=A0ABR2P3U6_9ROSI
MTLQTCKGTVCRSNSQRLTEENEPIGRVNCLKASWAGIVSKNIGCQGDKAEEDISHKLFRNAKMGFDLGRKECVGSLESNLPVDDKAKVLEGFRLSASKGYEVVESSVNRKDSLIAFEDGVGESGLFPVPAVHQPCKPKRGKKFGHPIEIHSKILETIERKNLDHFKKQIIKGTKNTIHEDRFLTISDSKVSCVTGFVGAKETSVMENIVGFKPFGTEQEVVCGEEVLDTSNLRNWPNLGLETRFSVADTF